MSLSFPNFWTHQQDDLCHSKALQKSPGNEWVLEILGLDIKDVKDKHHRLVDAPVRWVGPVKSHMAENQFGQLGIFQPLFGGVIKPRLIIGDGALPCSGYRKSL